MYDGPSFLKSLSEFTHGLLDGHDLPTVLHSLTTCLNRSLGLAGSSVLLTGAERPEVGTATPRTLANLEEVQCRLGSGPSAHALAAGDVVAVEDLTHRSHPWTEYADAAGRLGLRAAAGIPLRLLGGGTFGAVTMYAREVRRWSEEELAAASVMADVAVLYLVNASKLRQKEELAGQLQHALDARTVIEQAKGMIANAHRVGVDDAFTYLRQYARRNRMSLREVAETVVRHGALRKP